jgi:hypothetical protein
MLNRGVADRVDLECGPKRVHGQVTLGPMIIPYKEGKCPPLGVMLIGRFETTVPTLP